MTYTRLEGFALRVRRTGLTTVEIGLTLPLLTLVMLGTVEICNYVYLRQGARIAAYQCARVAITPGTEFEHIQDQCDVILQNRNIVNYSVDLSHQPDDLDGGDLLTVTVVIPFNENALVKPFFKAGSQIAEPVVIMKEH